MSWTTIECFSTIPTSWLNVFFIFTRARITLNDAIESYRLALVFFMICEDIFLVNRRKLTLFPLMDPLRSLLNDFLCHYFGSFASWLTLTFFGQLLVVFVFIFGGVIIMIDFGKLWSICSPLIFVVYHWDLVLLSIRVESWRETLRHVFNRPCWGGFKGWGEGLLEFYVVRNIETDRRFLIAIVVIFFRVVHFLNFYKYL